MTNFKFFLAGLACFMAGWFIVSVILPPPVTEARKAVIEAKEAAEFREKAMRQAGCIYIDPAKSEKF